MTAEKKSKYEKTPGSELDQTTSLAFTRTRLAADRTLMAWIRTAFAMISFGFGLIKFFEFLKAIENTNRSTDTKHLGVFLILLGIFSLVPAIISYRKELKAIRTMDKGPGWTFTLVIAIIVGIIGIYALIDALMGRLF